MLREDRGWMVLEHGSAECPPSTQASTDRCSPCLNAPRARRPDPFTPPLLPTSHRSLGVIAFCRSECNPRLPAIGRGRRTGGRRPTRHYPPGIKHYPSRFRLPASGRKGSISWTWRSSPSTIAWKCMIGWVGEEGERKGGEGGGGEGNRPTLGRRGPLHSQPALHTCRISTTSSRPGSWSSCFQAIPVQAPPFQIQKLPSRPQLQISATGRVIYQIQQDVTSLFNLEMASAR